MRRKNRENLDELAEIIRRGKFPPATYKEVLDWIDAQPPPFSSPLARARKIAEDGYGRGVRSDRGLLEIQDILRVAQPTDETVTSFGEEDPTPTPTA